MNTLDIKTAKNEYSLNFTADNALYCDMTMAAIKSYFINVRAYNDFMDNLHCDVINLTDNFMYSNLYHLDGQNLLASQSVKYKYTLKDGIVSLTITHDINKGIKTVDV